MSFQDYFPTSWTTHRSRNQHPQATLRQEMNNLFDDFGNGVFKGDSEVNIRLNVTETDKKICVTVELPRLTEEHVDVSVKGDCVVTQGEKKSEKEEKSDEKGREFHRIERSSGAFQRKMTLPFQIDPDKIDMVVKNGILTFTILKLPEVVDNGKKIAVKRAK